MRSTVKSVVLRVNGRALRDTEPEAEDEEPDSTVDAIERGIFAG